MDRKGEVAERLRQAVLQGDARLATSLMEEGLAERISPMALMERSLYPAASEIAQTYTRKEIAFAEILVKFQIIQSLLDELAPKLKLERKDTVSVRLMIGSIQGNLMDFGKLMLKIMFGVSGFEVIDLGTDVSPENIIQQVRLEKPDILALGVYTKDSLPLAIKTIEILKQENIGRNLKIMLGGWAVTSQFAEQVGADIFATSAEDAVQQCLAAVGN